MAATAWPNLSLEKNPLTTAPDWEGWEEVTAPCWVLADAFVPLFFYIVIIYNYVFCFPFFPDKDGFKSLGKFVSSPTKEKGNLQLSYTDGSDCGHKKITTNITLICKPGEPF